MRPRGARASLSPIALFVLSLVASQVNAESEHGLSLESSPGSLAVYTMLDLSTSSPDKRARKSDYQAHPAGELVCRPFGLCEPCPADERNQPFCQPFGNRRLLHCKSSKEGAESGDKSGEVPAWEACGKVIKQERQDFWEFVTANLLFLIVAMAVLWARSSALATAQYRQLAARIGIPGSGGWRG